METKIIFATDFHGSEKCFRKFLEVGKYFRPNCMILGGDLTGKVIVPIVKYREGLYKCHVFGHEYELHNNKDIKKMEKRLKTRVTIYTDVI